MSARLLLLLAGTGLALGRPALAQRERTAPTPTGAAPAAPTTQLFDAHLRFLMSDLFDHAAPGSRGAEIVARYVASQFEIGGLHPISGSFLQPLPLRGVTAEASIILGAGRETIALNPSEDFLVWPEATDSTVNLDADVAFAGYGIEAPEWGWDDYKGVPQTGKIVFALANDPGLRDSSIFNGAAPTKYGRPDFKLAEAAKMGAVGLLLIHTEASAGIPWRDLRTALSGEALMVDAKKPAPSPVRFAAWIRGDAVRTALQASGRDYELLLKRAQQREFSPILAGIHAAVDMRTRSRQFRGENVIARLDGKGTPGEIVVAARATDAPATALLITIASALVRGPVLPRSVVFISTIGRAGEDYFESDSGLYGDLAAAITLASGGAPDTAPRVLVRGGGYSSLGPTLATIAGAEYVTVVPDPSDPAFMASAAFSFAVRGVPAVELASCRVPQCMKVLTRLVAELASAMEGPKWSPKSPFRLRSQ